MYLVGSYSQNSNGRAIYKLDYEKGRLKIVDTLESGINPSFFLPKGDSIILLNEIDHRDNLRVLNRRGELETIYSSGGVGPCHINCFEDYTSISNYTSGSLSLLKGSTILDTWNFKGSGPNKERQESSHVHSSIYSTEHSTLYSIDLGRDSVDCFSIEKERLNYISTLKLSPGDGPRMMAVNGDLGYIVNELSNSVTVVKILDNGTLEEVGRYSTLPGGFTGESYASHIDIYNGALYISNRGYDSIVVYPIKNNTLGEPRWIELRGSFPRHFIIDKTILLVANQESNSVEVVDLETSKFITSVEIYKPTVISKV